MQSKLFVQNLASRISENDLIELFSPYGEVLSTSIPKDRYSGQPRGFGFVEMNDQGSAKTALESLNNKEYRGRLLYIEFSRTKQRIRNRQIAYGFLC